MLVPSKSCIDEKLSKPEMLNFELNTEGREREEREMVEGVGVGVGGINLSAMFYLRRLLLVQVLKDKLMCMLTKNVHTLSFQHCFVGPVLTARRR